MTRSHLAPLDRSGKNDIRGSVLILSPASISRSEIVIVLELALVLGPLFR